MMDFVPDLGDTSSVPRFHVGGVGRAEIIDNCVICVTLYEPRCAGTGHVPAVQLFWTIPAWRSARPLFAQITNSLSAAEIGAKVVAHVH